MEDRKLQKLKAALELLNVDTMSSADFTKAFEKVMQIFVAMRTANETERANLLSTFEKKMGEMEMMMKEHGAEMSDGTKNAKKEMMEYCMAEMRKMHTEQATGMNMLRDKLREVKDGKDADEQKIIKEVLALIPPVKELQPETPASIANKLESIEPEDEKLKISAIRDLQKELDELRKLRGQVFGGGGGFSTIAFNSHMLDWTVLATGDDVTTDFTIGHTPNPTESLEVTVGGGNMFLTDDYTYNATTRVVSFVTAPPTGAKIRYRCRI